MSTPTARVVMPIMSVNELQFVPSNTTAEAASDNIIVFAFNGCTPSANIGNLYVTWLCEYIPTLS